MIERACTIGKPFVMTVPLASGVQAEQAIAQYKDGMLEVTIPKSGMARVKEAPISV